MNPRIAAAALSLTVLAACADSPTAADGLIDENAVTLDIAASAGEAAVSLLETMSANVVDASGSANLVAGPAANTALSVSRTRTCRDAADAVVADCKPFSSVRLIATAASISGSRSSTRTHTGGATVTWSGVVNRNSNDTTRRIFNGSTETSRVHNGVSIGYDTTTFTDGGFTRLMAETSRDTVKSITFNLPRSSNPYPASGSIVRLDSVHVEVSREGRSASRDFVRVVEVIFPADAQGNVTLKVNAKTCKLNLVTRAVSGCA